jgi:trehalose 6-phosphate phosphatase
MPEQHLSPPVLGDLSETAIFLDFDGTLAEFADHPDAVSVPDALISRLGELHELTDGAVAVITGRDVAEIDAFLAPLKLPVAGVHGLVRRRADGALVAGDIDYEGLDRIAASAQALAARTPGVIVERKSCAVALHYRKRPEAGPACDAVMADAAHANPGFKLQRGKAVAEVRSRGHDKGGAIEAFLDEPPFKGRRPVFAGDDVTDEDGFVALEPLAGITIKVGDGATAAQYRVGSVSELRDWLHAIGGTDADNSEAAE